MTETLVVMAKVSSSAHFTLAFKTECTNEERALLIEKTNRVCKKLLPIECKMGDAVKMGPKRDMDAVSVSIANAATHTALQKFWAAEQRRAPGEEMFEFTPHVTLNSQEKRDSLATLIMEHGWFSIDEVIVRTYPNRKIVATIQAQQSLVSSGVLTP